MNTSGSFACLVHDCLSHDKNISQIPIGEHTTIYLTSTPQNCQSHQKQVKFE